MYVGVRRAHFRVGAIFISRTVHHSRVRSVMAESCMPCYAEVQRAPPLIVAHKVIRIGWAREYEGVSNTE